MAIIIWQKLTISLEGFDCSRLFGEWRWLVPESASPQWLTGFGDCAFTFPDQAVFFLDVLEGTFNRVAASERDLDSFFQSGENRNRWLSADWFDICNQRGLFLGQGQCYGWKVAPILGGKFEFSNIQVFDIEVYESITGQLHRQLKDLPEGYSVSELKIRDN
jgi:T6SS immunity protein Tdi1, C-terminal